MLKSLLVVQKDLQLNYNLTPIIGAEIEFYLSDNIQNEKYRKTVRTSIDTFERGFGEDREPLCCNEIMQRQWTGSVGVIFNGSGFYSTDNKK